VFVQVYASNVNIFLGYKYMHFWYDLKHCMLHLHIANFNYANTTSQNLTVLHTY